MSDWLVVVYPRPNEVEDFDRYALPGSDSRTKRKIYNFTSLPYGIDFVQPGRVARRGQCIHCRTLTVL